MTTITQTPVKTPEAENHNLRALMRRPIALLSAAAVIGLTTLGVMTLGTLYGGDPTNAAASGTSVSTHSNVSGQTYKLDGDELVSERRVSD